MDRGHACYRFWRLRPFLVQALFYALVSIFQNIKLQGFLQKCVDIGLDSYYFLFLLRFFDNFYNSVYLVPFLFNFSSVEIFFHFRKKTNQTHAPPSCDSLLNVYMTPFQRKAVLDIALVLQASAPLWEA